MNVTLNYHRRHGLNCAGNHLAGTYTSDSDERKKGWKRCTCPIYASGSLNRVARRFATKRTDWQQAKDLMAPYIANNSWEPPDLSPPPPEDVKKLETPRGTLVPVAVKAFIKDHEKVRSAANTIRSYRYRTGKLERYSVEIGLNCIDEWTPLLVRQFRDSWGVSPLTASKDLSILKAFFEFCKENEWIKENPARIKTRRNRAITADSTDLRQRVPFTDEELGRMYDGCKDYGKTLVREWPQKRNGKQVVAVTPYRDYHRKWTGQDLEDFISVSIYTGLRISDVATFHIDRLRANGEVLVRTTKNGKGVYTWVPDWLATRIRTRAVQVGPHIFGEHRTKDLNVITQVWRKKLNVLWEQAGPWKLKPVPHRFRHTFARILLQNGTPVPVVADLMGDTEAVVKKYYSDWVPERQERTTAILKAAFASTPQPIRMHG